MEGIAKAIGAEPGNDPVWALDLKAGRVTVSVEPSEPGKKEPGKKKSSKRS